MPAAFDLLEGSAASLYGMKLPACTVFCDDFLILIRVSYINAVQCLFHDNICHRPLSLMHHKISQWMSSGHSSLSRRLSTGKKQLTASVNA